VVTHPPLGPGARWPGTSTQGLSRAWHTWAVEPSRMMPRGGAGLPPWAGHGPARHGPPIGSSRGREAWWARGRWSLSAGKGLRLGGRHATGQARAAGGSATIVARARRAVALGVPIAGGPTAGPGGGCVPCSRLTALRARSRRGQARWAGGGRPRAQLGLARYAVRARSAPAAHPPSSLCSSRLGARRKATHCQDFFQARRCRQALFGGQ